jgi:hypothetical protein
MSWSLFVLNELRWEVVVRVVDIGGKNEKQIIPHCWNNSQIQWENRICLFFVL